MALVYREDTFSKVLIYERIKIAQLTFIVNQGHRRSRISIDLVTY